MAHKINITSLTPLSAGVWPTLHHPHTSYSFCLFLQPCKWLLPKRPLTKGDVQAHWQAAMKRKITLSPPDLREGQHYSYPSRFWEGNTEPCLLPAAQEDYQQQPERAQGPGQFPESQSISVPFCSAVLDVQTCFLRTKAVLRGTMAPSWTCWAAANPRHFIGCTQPVFCSHILPSLPPFEIKQQQKHQVLSYRTVTLHAS